MDSPFVSVVMPNYNGRRFVDKAIDSVLNQTYKHFEFIIVDDCSTDGSLSFLKEKSRIDKRICVFEQEHNGGVANARNVGIKAAKGDYIALIDNDDIWEPDKIERQLLIAEKGADIVYCSLDFIDENGRHIKKPFIVPETADYHSMLGSCVLTCSTVFIRADLLKAHPFASDYYHEDYVLWMELLKLPVKVKGDKKILMHNRQVSGSRSNRKGNAAKERWHVYRKALKMNLADSSVAFVRYAVNGVLKYYF